MPRHTFVTRIEGRKSQYARSGEVFDKLDRDGNIKPYWALAFEFMTQEGVGERFVYVFPNQFSGGRHGETMFWTSSHLSGLVQQIQSVEVGQVVKLEEKLPISVQYDGNFFQILSIGSHSNTTEATESPTSPPAADNQVIQNTAAIENIQGDIQQMMELLQKFVNQQ